MKKPPLQDVIVRSSDAPRRGGMRTMHKNENHSTHQEQDFYENKTQHQYENHMDASFHEASQ